MSLAERTGPHPSGRRDRRAPVILPEERLEHIRVFVALAAQSMQPDDQRDDQRAVVPSPPPLHTTDRSVPGRRAARVTDPERPAERPVGGKRARRLPQG
ncbi:MAG TPA: hypothetical protein VFK34_05230 [Marmoricola sp.]|jgi:hypothetical protein|nr:hypothetical protein [Marmoricola sp.]